MRSSRTEPEPHTDLLKPLEQIVECYHLALQALAGGDIEKADQLVRLAGATLQPLQEGDISEAGSLGQQATDLHSQLTAVAGAAQLQIKEQLRDTKSSKRALGGYGGRSHGTGKRLDRSG